MSRFIFGGINASAFALVLSGLVSQSAGAQEPNQSYIIQRGMERAAAADPIGPSSVEDVQGTFRVSGKIRKKTAGLTSCTCYVYFYHDNLVGGDYYTYRNKTIGGNNCKFNVPFRFPLGDTGRPVVMTLSANCTGSNRYRYYSADLPDIPLKSGKSKVVKFDIDM
jgi:hypothetical protein